ncbi:hypothetical protein [Wolbachia endosymbiont (group E) of Neria commutata]|uniref:hypothetical protein n=1 Tax=Wolbachia endosymbiont (group E) of Neria commutata TaxID=3066149 RepID=UPI003133080A
MAAKIELKKLIGMSIVDGATQTVINEFPSDTAGNIPNIHIKKLVFAGQDYKGILDNEGKDAATGKHTVGTLELCLERPDNCFKIEGVKVKGTSHKYHKKGAEIDITVTSPKITEKDSGWFTTELTATPNTLKFGEWNDFDLSDKCHVNIDFA